MSAGISTFRSRASTSLTARQGASCGTLTVADEEQPPDGGNGGTDGGTGGRNLGLLLAVVGAGVAVALSGSTTRTRR